MWFRDSESVEPDTWKGYTITRSSISPRYRPGIPQGIRRGIPGEVLGTPHRIDLGVPVSIQGIGTYIGPGVPHIGTQVPV